MSIEDSKERLFISLKDNKDVVGTGTTRVKKLDTIVVYLTKGTMETICGMPKEFEGFPIQMKMVGDVKDMEDGIKERANKIKENSIPKKRKSK